jgi:hypothetical protein
MQALSRTSQAPNEFTICRIMMSERIEEITNSSGDRFDAKRKQLAGV